MPKADVTDEQPAYLRALDMHLHPGVNRDIDRIGPVLRQARRELDDLTRAAVANARRRGEPWSRIGPALGITRQSAQQKYGDPDAT